MKGIIFLEFVFEFCGTCLRVKQALPWHMESIQTLLEHNYIQRAQRKKVEKTGKNNAVAKQNKTMKIVQFVMLAMIIFMGFTLPSAMGVYCIFSLAQTLIMHFVTNRKGKKSEPKHKEPKNKENIGDKVVLEAAPIEVIEETSTTNETPKQNKNNKKKNNYKEFKYPKKRGGRR